MKRLIYLILGALICVQIIMAEDQSHLREVYSSMADDPSLPIEQRLGYLDSLLTENPSDLNAILRKWKLAMGNGYYTIGHEALSKLYTLKYDSLDTKAQCELLRDYAMSLEMTGSYDRAAAIAVKLLQKEKPDSLKSFEFDAYLQFASIYSQINNKKNFERVFKKLEGTYDELMDKKLLNPYYQKKFKATILKGKLQTHLWNDRNDSALLYSERLLENACDYNDTIVAYISKAYVYKNIGRQDLREKVYLEAILHPGIYVNTSQVIYYYIMLLNEQERFQELVDVYDKYSTVLEANATPAMFIGIMQYKAHALSKLGHYQQSDSLYWEALNREIDARSYMDGLISEDLANYDMEDLVTTKITAESSAKKGFFVNIVLCGFIAVCIGIIAYFIIQRRKLREKEEAAELIINEEKRRIEDKEHELTTMSLQLLNMRELIARMEEIVQNDKADKDQKLFELQSLLREANGSSSIWEIFKQYFEETHDGFIDKLTNAHPTLTENDVKICAFIMLNFTTKEIASLTHRSIRTIENHKYRLHKKFNLPEGTTTLQYLRTL